MSYYKISSNDVKHYITSFNNSEVFYDYFRNMINNVDCMGIYCQDSFFFEKYNFDMSIRIKNDIIINYILENTHQFFDIINDINSNDNEYYIYFPNYAIMIDNELNIYKIYLGHPNTFINPETKYHLSKEPIENNFGFENEYTFSTKNDLKENIIRCLKGECADLYINDNCFFDATSSKKVDIINNMIVRNHIIDNIDEIFNNVFVDTIVINMYDKVCAFNCHTILITFNDNINVFISRTYYY